MIRKIVTDSSSDLLKLKTVPFNSAPLKIITTNKEYIDDENLDVSVMVDDFESYNGRSSTSCPNVGDWLKAFGDADEIFCITITGTLSGSYNSAVLAKETYEEMYPERRVFVLNSLSTGPEMALIIEKIQELIVKEKTFDEIVEKIENYRQKTGLLFMLQSMKNLVNNGRVSPIVAKVAGLLGIRVVGTASEQGDLKTLNKCRGEAKALEAIVESLKSVGFKGGKIKISHCLNKKAGEQLKTLILKEFSKAKVEITKCRGLCSFYAERGGLLIGFERI